MLQLGEIGRGDVGDGAEGEAILLPREPMVALGLAGARQRGLRLGLFDKEVNDVFAPGVDKGGDGAPAGDIEAAAE